MLTEKPFDRSVVVLTGASGLIGPAIAQAFALRGATVVLAGADDDGLTELADQLQSTGAVAHVCAGDITRTQTIPRIVETALDAGGLDVLVNNAGLTDTVKPFLETDAGDWDAIHSVNTRGLYLLSLQVARFWRDQGQGGSIVNISSPGATRAHRHNSIYDASKGAVEALTRAMAVELGPIGIRVNAVSPAAVSVPLRTTPTLPLRRCPTPSDVADAVVFLASEAASSITGHVLAVDGGLGAQLRTPVAPPGGAPSSGEEG